MGAMFSLLLCLSCTSPSIENSGDNSNVSDPAGETAKPEVQPDYKLQDTIAEIAKEAKGKVGVYAVEIETDRSVYMEPNERFAMQSVYKLPIAMAALRYVEKGKIDLDEKVGVARTDLVGREQHSPLRDEHPNGAEVTVRELLRLAVSESDGTASDVLMDLIGGAKNVQAYLDELGIVEMIIKNSEKEIGASWRTQYDNWASPEAAVALLTALEKGEGISRENREILLEFMTRSPTGEKRLKGALPAGTVVAHKTGASATRDGVTAATNDIGIISLPNGGHIAIAVFLGDSIADEKSREAVIAKIAKAVWDKWCPSSETDGNMR